MQSTSIRPSKKPRAAGEVLPRRSSNLCSRKHCAYWRECRDDYGGEVTREEWLLAMTEKVRPLFAAIKDPFPRVVYENGLAELEDTFVTARIVSGDNHPTLAEKHAIAVLAVFEEATVTRTRDVIQINIDGERGCTVLITSEAADIRLPTIEWTGGAYGPRESSRHWKRVALRPMDAAYRRLNKIIQAAMAARIAEYRNCCFCKREFPPERMTDDACHGCASAHRHIVY